MTPLLENAAMVTNLDGRFNDLLNIGAVIPPPPDLVIEGDPRLSDARAPLPGSVTNVSVAATAAIVQSKLDLNGDIPISWLGTTSGDAAQGDLAEYHFNKDQPNGYASLDGTGHLPVSELPLGGGTGTITSIGLTMPGTFGVTGSPVTASGIISVSWNAVPDGSWFGNSTGSSAAPAFNTAPIPLSLVPNLDASQVTSGVFAAARIPLAVGVGAGHAPGAAPDPGATGSELDYLGRDMTYHPVPSFGPGYQPVVPSPVLAINTGPPPYLVSVISSLEGVSMFYAINHPIPGAFSPVPDDGIIELQLGQRAYCYSAKAGYTNSPLVYIDAPVAPRRTRYRGDLFNAIVTGDDSQSVTVGP
jgi:hypothetical protein